MYEFTTAYPNGLPDEREYTRPLLSLPEKVYTPNISIDTEIAFITLPVRRFYNNFINI